MSKIYFVGDLHLQEQSPISRKDSYPTAILDKIYEIGKLVEANKIDKVIFLGDIFSVPNMYSSYLNRVIEAFSSIKCPLYTIVGNHDIPRNNLESFKGSLLWLLMKVGLLKQLDILEEKNYIIKGFNYTDEIVPIERTSKETICVAHKYFNIPLFGKDSLSEEELLNYGYKVYILGHGHDVYDRAIYKDFSVIRDGSLSRGSKANSQLYRDEVYITEYNSDTQVFTRVSVPCKKASEVFKDRIFIEKQEASNKNLEEVLLKFDYSQENSIYDYIDEVNIEEECKNLIISYLEGRGIIRIGN